MKFYQEKFFDRRNWILDNLEKININAEETLLILLIDFLNQYNQKITIELLEMKLSKDAKEIDRLLNSLSSKGLLVISTSSNGLRFNIDSVFQSDNKIIESNDIFELFERELGKTISQSQASTISDWLVKYDYQSIVNALREAIINNKKSLAYIEKILINNHEKQQ